MAVCRRSPRLGVVLGISSIIGAGSPCPASAPMLMSEMLLQLSDESPISRRSSRANLWFPVPVSEILPARKSVRLEMRFWATWGKSGRWSLVVVYGDDHHCLGGCASHAQRGCLESLDARLFDPKARRMPNDSSCTSPFTTTETLSHCRLPLAIPLYSEWYWRYVRNAQAMRHCGKDSKAARGRSPPRTLSQPHRNCIAKPHQGTMRPPRPGCATR